MVARFLPPVGEGTGHHPVCREEGQRPVWAMHYYGRCRAGPASLVPHAPTGARRTQDKRMNPPSGPLQFNGMSHRRA